MLSRIWALVYELRAELIRKARLQETGEDDETVRDAGVTVLWVIARLLTRIHEYLERYGNRILHGGAAEYRVEGLIRLAGWHHELSAEHALRIRLLCSRADGDRRRFDRLLRGDPAFDLLSRN